MAPLHVCGLSPGEGGGDSLPILCVPVGFPIERKNGDLFQGRCSGAFLLFCAIVSLSQRKCLIVEVSR